MKNFLLLLLTVSVMLFVSFNVLAEEDGPFPSGRNPGPADTDSLKFHIAEDGVGSDVPTYRSDVPMQGAPSKVGAAPPGSTTDYCEMCNPNLNLGSSEKQGTAGDPKTTTPTQGTGAK